ncbi:hypothetical protein [Phyllobacterium chamaecytisi]|uniref:hypothetical protein n=1 Tax=Phyllobacterium chamaecytisi TaxID=2876082 RepID=UPI001CCD2B72|nr:hypothetical protein [Phyllobacterium sp. KW56]MBZ9602541.1 hypothetical protein [Phyllobacterium sp. KW56]
MSTQLTAAEAILRFRVRVWIEPLERATATTAQNHHQACKNDKTHNVLREIARVRLTPVGRFLNRAIVLDPNRKSGLNRTLNRRIYPATGRLQLFGLIGAGLLINGITRQGQTAH